MQTLANLHLKKHLRLKLYYYSHSSIKLWKKKVSIEITGTQSTKIAGNQSISHQDIAEVLTYLLLNDGNKKKKYNLIKVIQILDKP